MRHLCTRRVLGWSLFAVLLVGLAWALYVLLPAEPRWVRRGPITLLELGPDGKSLMTGTMSANLPLRNNGFVVPERPPVGPVQLWDIATGQEVWSVLGDGGPRWQVAISADLTRLAAYAPPTADAGQAELRVIDLATGQERRASIEHPTECMNTSFSPAGTLLMLRDWDVHGLVFPSGIGHNFLYETASLRLVAKCEVTTLPSDEKVRAESRALLRLFDETIETKDFVQPMPLKQALQLLYEKFAAKDQELPIIVDINAFKEAGDTQPDGPYEDEVKLPATPKVMTVDMALRLIVSQIKTKNADYMIRGNYIEVTTKDRKARERWPRWRWSPDGKALLVFATDSSGNGQLRRITAEGETITKLHGAGDWLDVSSDGKLLLTERPRTDGLVATPADTLLLWNLPAGTRHGVIHVEPYHPEALSNCVTFANDSRTLLITMGRPRPGNMLGAWDLDTQQWLGKMPLGAGSRTVFPEPGSVLLRHDDGDVQLAWYRLRPFAKLWQRAEPGDVLRMVDYLPDLDCLAVVSGEGGGNRVQLLEARTGTPRLDLPFDPGAFHYWLSRGNHFAVVTRHDIPEERGPIRAFIEEYIVPLLLPKRQRSDAIPTSTGFFDPATGAELCRIDDADADPMAITPDGSALILYQRANADGESAVICYDVPAARSWRFILGIPMALGIVLLTLRFGWRRIRRGGLPAIRETTLPRPEPGYTCGKSTVK